MDFLLDQLECLDRPRLDVTLEGLGMAIGHVNSTCESREGTIGKSYLSISGEGSISGMISMPFSMQVDTSNTANVMATINQSDASARCKPVDSAVKSSDVSVFMVVEG